VIADRGLQTQPERRCAYGRRVADFWLRLVGLVLVVVGYFGPWIPHKAVALTVTGFELAEITKTMPVTNELFLIPPVAAAILIGLSVHRAAGRLSTRLIGTAFAALLALSALPPYEYIHDPQYHAQLILAAGGVLLVLLTFLTRRLARRAQGVLVVTLALAGAVPALWQFVLLRPLVVALYNAPLNLGWGLIICAAGFVLLLLSSVLPNREN
jgi:hypothetical protein